MFAYGLAVGRFKVFPYGVIRDARTAFVALIGTSQGSELDGDALWKHPVHAPTARKHAPTAGPEMILVSGGPGYLSDHHNAGCLAWLMDRDGRIRHVWKYDPSLWENLQKVTQLPVVSGPPYPVGIHLFDNGELLVTYHASNSFPFAVGIARFDADSNLLWKKELLAHHWLSVAEDGRIFVPALRVIDSPIPIAKTEARITSDTGKIYSDVVLILDPDGNVLDEIPMLDALFESGWEGLFTRADSATHSGDFATDDPLHLNDVRLVTPEIAKWQPWLSPGDLLVSFRNINAVGILDIASHRFKWMTSGSTIAQHSPRFYDGGVLILDNLGGDQQLGGTRLVKIDLDRGLPTVLFPQPGVETPDLCRTQNCGHLDVNQDGKRVLMAVTRSGALWEINLTTGKVLWEYLYVHPDGDGTRKAINTAKYVYSAPFLHNFPHDTERP